MQSSSSPSSVPPVQSAPSSSSSSSSSLYCIYCDVTLNSQASHQHHLQSKTHKKMLHCYARGVMDGRLQSMSQCMQFQQESRLRLLQQLENPDTFIHHMIIAPIQYIFHAYKDKPTHLSPQAVDLVKLLPSISPLFSASLSACFHSITYTLNEKHIKQKIDTCNQLIQQLLLQQHDNIRELHEDDTDMNYDADDFPYDEYQDEE